MISAKDPRFLFVYDVVTSGYFNSVSHALEIKTRTQLINEKITYAAELQSVLRQLLTEVDTQLLQYRYHQNLTPL